MGSDELVERLRKRGLNHGDFGVASMMYEAADEIERLTAQLAEARESERAAAWVYPKSIADMPSKPGKEAYEHVPCLIVRKGEVLSRPWNCEHQVFDDEDQDDFYCEWDAVTAYMDLSGLIKAYAPPAAGEPA